VSRETRTGTVYTLRVSRDCGGTHLTDFGGVGDVHRVPKCGQPRHHVAFRTEPHLSSRTSARRERDLGCLPRLPLAALVLVVPIPIIISRALFPSSKRLRRLRCPASPSRHDDRWDLRTGREAVAKHYRPRYDVAFRTARHNVDGWIRASTLSILG
jgi:hypothetical protein